MVSVMSKEQTRGQRAAALAAQAQPQTSEPIKPAPLTPEQEAEQTARVNKCSEGIKALLKEHRCILTVPTLDISTGRMFPQIQLRAQP